MRRTALAIVAAIAATAIPLQAAGAHGTHDPGGSHDPSALLREVRKATKVYRDVDAARAAGYKAAPDCAEDPKYGGMGIHYANQKLIADGRLDPLRPEILVYQPHPGGKPTLGAVEYFQPDGDQDLDTDDDKPSLFGMPFDGPMKGHEPGMPKHYDLHVWLYEHNPAGLFAAWNPRVHCP